MPTVTASLLNENVRYVGLRLAYTFRSQGLEKVEDRVSVFKLFMKDLTDLDRRETQSTLS